MIQRFAAMSTSLPAQPSSPKPSSGTKQLLEELDALMQRMLAVPVNDLGDTVETKASAAPTTEPLTVAASEPPSAIDAEQASAACEAQIPATTAHVVTAPDEAAASLASSERQPQLKESSIVLEPGEIPLGGFWPHPALNNLPRAQEAGGQPAAPSHWAPPPVQRPPLSLSPSPPLRTRSTNWWLRSLLWSNRTFDRGAAVLGRPGRCLQGRGARMLLGWLGIALLVGSLAWGLSAWFDWTW
jgi:hypothetical protein